MAGRGRRLLENLQKIKEKQIGVTGDEEKKEEAASPSTPPSARSQPRTGGGRGKLLHALSTLTSSTTASRAESPPRESSSSSSSGQPSPSGAVGGSPPHEQMEQLKVIEEPERRQFPSQPDPILNKARGTDGQTIQLALNYVRIEQMEGFGIYEYHVSFAPNIDSRALRSKILRQNEVTDKLGSVMQFTGMNLFLPKLIENISITTTTPTDGSPMKVTLQFIKVPPFHELIPFYNTMFRKIMHELKLVQIQRHYYDPTSKIDVPIHKLEIWPGYVTSIQDMDGGLLLNCDASHRILRTNTARDVLFDIFKLPDGKNRFKELAQKRLVGCVVLTRYNNMPYRIDDIQFNENPNSTFNWNGTDVTYVEYFKKSWEITITDLRQPLLVHRPKPRKGETESRLVCLIPELCFMTGLTDDIRADTRAMKDIASHTRIKPGVRQAKLQQFINNVHTNQRANAHLQNWGLRLDGAPYRTEGRTMGPDKILFANELKVPVGPKAEWSREACNSRLFSPIDVQKWLMISTKRDSARTDEFIKTLKLVTRNMGFNFGDPDRMESSDDSPMSYTLAVKQAYLPVHQIVVMMTPGSSQREDRYNAIKRLCCCEIGVPSQVVRANTLSDTKMRSVCQKIAIQISCKIGGQPWAIPIPFKSCMIVGIDVYHDPTQRGKSVVGIVASINGAVTRWYSRAYFQNTHEEIVNTLESGIVSCLKKYYDTNNFLPQRIFIYRDGVSDGQLSVVRDYEIVQIENAIMDFGKNYSNYMPTLTVVIVQKRINTKLLMIARNEFDNPPPGSVLDHSVTRKNYYDFFLISQFVNQGTVTPTHYIVIHDTNEMPPDRMQRLSYKMTHLYYNWPGTIRVPAPCQYAHKAANLVGQNIKKSPAEALADKLYFL